MIDKKFWSTVFTLTGGVVGAGILGLPYVFVKAGFFIGLFWLIFLGSLIIFVGLLLGEISLRTKGNHHLIGYAKKYLGKIGAKIMLVAFLFGIYAALLAYLIGEGESLSKLFTGATDYSLYFTLGFWAIMTLLLKEGLRGLRKLETWGVLAIIGIVSIMFFWFCPEIKLSNLNHLYFSNFFFPFGVVLFAILGFSSIPELRREIKGNENNFKKAIFLGFLIPIILYAVFSLIFVGVLGQNVPEIATLGFGKIVVLLGIFTMLTSYFVLSFALKDALQFDLYFKKKKTFFFVSIFPLILYLLAYFFSFLSFVTILSLGGVISGGTQGILILLINKKSKKKGNRKPEYTIPTNWFFIVLLSFIFIFGIFLGLFS